MASVGRERAAEGTRYYIQLSPGEHEGRPKIRLGRVSRKQAECAKAHIETLLAGRRTGCVVPPATQQWVADLPEALRQRLEKLRILAAKDSAGRYSVGEWVARYIAGRPDVKAATRRRYRDVERKLVAFFRDTPIDNVTVQAAKDFRVYLRNVVGLAENTTRREIAIVRQFFNAAVDANLIRQNPFRGQPVSLRPNEARFFFITPEMAQKVLDACPDAEWRLIFGLARFGGLRCPSEVLRLKWEDIDFANEQFTVHASKTEHHGSGGIRTVPMFPELKLLFQDAFDAAREGSVYCIERCRDAKVNLRTQLTRIIKRAGLEPWPKLFQNLRSTRETELFRLTGGNVKAVCTWIGNSPAVAMQHYAQVTEADYRDAAKLSVLTDAKKAVHNPVQNPAVPSCTEPHESPDAVDVNPCLCGTNQENAT